MVFLELFINRLHEFSRKNWWVYILFLVAFGVVLITERGNPWEVAIVFMCHLLGDLFVMLMVYENAHQKYKEAAWFQLLCTLIFSGLGLYAGLTTGAWQYFLPQLVFSWGSLVVFARAYGWGNLPTGLTVTMSSIAVTVFLGWWFSLVQGVLAWWQFSMFLLTALAFALPDGKMRYTGSFISAAGLALASGIMLVFQYLSGWISGVSVSYTLLPLTVAVFYLTIWRHYFGNSAVVSPSLDAVFSK